jgi:hypothetical protein
MEANNSCDKLYIHIGELVRFNLKNFNPSLRDNALHINNLLKGYGDVPHLDYDAETAAITSIVTRLRSSAYLPAVTNLGLVPWINELDTQNNLFKSYAAEAEKERVNRPDITPRASRNETDIAQRAIIDRATAMIIMNGEANYVAFADEFNTLTNHYNTLVHEHYGRLHARTDISHADVDTIADQPFDGEPVYVIPKVSVTVTDRGGNTKTVKLVFAVDFTVSYEDNTTPGTAKLFIRGIGRYVGEQIVSFNIKRIDN